MVTPNSYMFRPLTGHHQVVHLMKTVGGCKMCNVNSHCTLYSPQPFSLDVQTCTGLRAVECNIVHCTLYSPQPFSLNVQPDDGLLGAETCSCYVLT